MANWTAWTRRATDAELVSFAEQLFPAAADVWCFVEGPRCSDFVGLEEVADRCGDAWSVRVFGEDREIAARRRGFEDDSPWLVRVIGRVPPPGDGWQGHPIDTGEKQVMILYGTADEEGRFIEGQQFRDAFRYPGVLARPGDRAALVVHVHPCDEGAPIVRWVALRPLEQPSAAGRNRW